MLTARQDNRLTAAENILAAFDRDPTPYAQDKALQQVRLELSEIIGALAPLRQQGLRTAKTKNGQKTGAALSKADRKALLCTAAGEVAGDLYAYASTTQNRALQATADHSPATLSQKRATALLDLAEDIHQAATTHAKPLQDYGLTKERLQELQDAIDAFSGTKNAPTEQISEGKTARLAIKGQFTQLATLLEDRLDRSLRKYARSSPDFYQRLTQARQVIDRPGSRKGGGDAGEAPKA